LIATMNRRSMLRLVAAGASASVLACSVAPQAAAPTAGATAKPVSSTTTTATSQPAAEAPETGGVLKQAYQGDPVSLDPMLKVQNDLVWIGVFERLTAYDDQLKPQPMLAESWDISSDAKQVKFSLRRGVQFHSGRQMTSDDVKYSLQRAANPKVAAAQYTGMASNAWIG
jgi:ABC-type transport system substrate-binding protein